MPSCAENFNFIFYPLNVFWLYFSFLNYFHCHFFPCQYVNAQMYFPKCSWSNRLSFINSNFTQNIIANFFGTFRNLYGVFDRYIWKRWNLVFGLMGFRLIFDRRRVIEGRLVSIHKIRIINLLGEAKNNNGAVIYVQ